MDRVFAKRFAPSVSFDGNGTNVATVNSEPPTAGNGLDRCLPRCVQEEIATTKPPPFSTLVPRNGAYYEMANTSGVPAAPGRNNFSLTNTASPMLTLSSERSPAYQGYFSTGDQPPSSYFAQTIREYEQYQQQQMLRLRRRNQGEKLYMCHQYSPAKDQNSITRNPVRLAPPQLPPPVSDIKSDFERAANELLPKSHSFDLKLAKFVQSTSLLLTPTSPSPSAADIINSVDWAPLTPLSPPEKPRFADLIGTSRTLSGQDCFGQLNPAAVAPPSPRLQIIDRTFKIYDDEEEEEEEEDINAAKVISRISLNTADDICKLSPLISQHVNEQDLRPLSKKRRHRSLTNLSSASQSNHQTIGKRRSNSSNIISKQQQEQSLTRGRAKTVDPTKPGKHVGESDRKSLELYKTEMCRSFEETGKCRYGNKCHFAHSKQELRQVERHPRYKTEFCKTYSETGTCPYGKRCCFIHAENGDCCDGESNERNHQKNSSLGDKKIKHKSRLCCRFECYFRLTIISTIALGIVEI